MRPLPQTRRARPAVLAGAAPPRGAGAALRKLRHASLSRDALLRALPLRRERMGCGRAERHIETWCVFHRPYFDGLPVPYTVIQVRLDCGVRCSPIRPGSSPSYAAHRHAGRGRVRGRDRRRDPAEVQAEEGHNEGDGGAGAGRHRSPQMETDCRPDAGPKDVVIKVDACGVCFHDIVTRNGTLKFGVQMPCILGHEISGTVVDTGRDVRGFRKPAIVSRPCSAITSAARAGTAAWARDAVSRPQVHRRCRHGRRLCGICGDRGRQRGAGARGRRAAGRLDRRLRGRHHPQCDARGRKARRGRERAGHRRGRRARHACRAARAARRRLCDRADHLAREGRADPRARRA